MAEYDLVILDEINNTLQTELLTLDDVMALLDIRPSWLHLMLTPWRPTRTDRARRPGD